jgi:hypothetical protein
MPTIQEGSELEKDETQTERETEREDGDSTSKGDAMSASEAENVKDGDKSGTPKPLISLCEMIRNSLQMLLQMVYIIILFALQSLIKIPKNIVFE